MRTTPTNVLLDINGEPPLKARWHMNVMKFLGKTTARLSHPLNSLINYILQLDNNKNISYLFDSYLESVDVLGQAETFELPGNLGYLYEYTNFTPYINIDIGRQIMNEPEINSSLENFVAASGFEATFYTDGSRNETEERIGYATYSPELNIENRVRINNLNNIFEAESLAILSAINTIYEKSISNVVIFSDSLSVLQSLMNQSDKKNNTTESSK